jgi:hypothetical protein
VLVVAGVAVWQGVAWAGGLMSTRGRTVIESQGASCGSPTGNPVIGWAKVVRREKKTEIDYRLIDALPNTVYTVYLYENAPVACTSLAVLGTVKTDDEGNAPVKKFFYKLSPTITQVFTDGFDGSSANDSIAVNV